MENIKSAIKQEYDESDRIGDIFASWCVVGYVLLVLVAVILENKSEICFKVLASADSFPYWLASLGTLLGAIGSTEPFGAARRNGWRDWCLLFGWVVALAASVFALVYGAISGECTCR